MQNPIHWEEKERFLVLDVVRKQIQGRLPRVDVNRLRDEFVAWWNGQDRPATMENGADPSDGATEAATADAAPPPVIHRDPTAEEVFKLRMLIAETLWGEGFTGPGNTDFVLELISQFGLTKEHSVCVLGGGLAGAARAITKDKGAWVTAFEPQKDMVRMAREQCAVAGLAKRVVVEEFNPAAVAIPEHKFQTIISFDRLYAVQNKSDLLAKAAKGLADEGSLLITDYVVPRPPAPGRTEKWFDSYWGEPHPATAQEYVDLFQSLSLETRVKKDITASYVNMINAAMPKWNGLIELARQPDIDGVSRSFFARHLADEAKMWAARLDALAKGELQVHRFLAMKS